MIWRLQAESFRKQLFYLRHLVKDIYEAYRISVVVPENPRYANLNNGTLARTYKKMLTELVG